MKRAQEEKKKAAMLLSNDLRKRKQDMLAKQLEQQKILISRLDAGKGTMKPEDKEVLMNLIKTLQFSIEKSKADLEEYKSLSQSQSSEGSQSSNMSAPSTPVKTKEEVGPNELLK
jgi:TRAP-type mannitol/chloroaromatic compound transport system substrate-binding protein